MSAFMCSDTHLTALAVYAVRNGLSGSVRGGGEPDSDAGLVRAVLGVLERENIASLDARYPGDTGGVAVAQVDPRALVTEYPLITIIKACHCYAYQACEHRGWESSRAKDIIERVEEHAVRHLPGYADAPWGL
jgi:hypothetical protein